MNRYRDFDRIASAWLDLMPDEAPDRVIVAVLQAVETTSQARRPLVRGPRRSPAMTRFALIAAAAALGAAVLGGALFMAGGQPPNPGPTAAPLVSAAPTPTSPSPSASAASGAGVPSSLQYRWIGEPREIPGYGTSTRTALNFTDSTFCVTGTSYGLSQCGLLTSDASVPAPGEIELRSTTTRASQKPCSDGDAGGYRWTLSPGGTVLTIQPGADDCATRAAAVVGTWRRVACKNTEDGCWGELEAGTHPSQYFTPRVDPHGAWEPDLGAVTFTVPDGWANSTDWPNDLTLTPKRDYASEGTDGPPDGVYHEVRLLAQPFAAIQDGQCLSVPDETVDRSVDGLVTWLRELPALDVGTPQAVTIDGNPAVKMDIQVAADWSAACPDLGPSIEYLARARDQGPGYATAIQAGERQRLTLVDLGDGDVLAILIDSTDGSRFDELAAAAEPIIGSLRIR